MRGRTSTGSLPLAACGRTAEEADGNGQGDSPCCREGEESWLTEQCGQGLAGEGGMEGRVRSGDIGGSQRTTIVRTGKEEAGERTEGVNLC